MAKRKPIDLQAGDRVSIDLDGKCLVFNRRQFWFREWNQYLKDNGLALMYESYSGSYDYFTVQKIGDVQTVYVS